MGMLDLWDAPVLARRHSTKRREPLAPGK